MKKTIILVLAVSLIIAGVAMATVVSSKHDMRSNATMTGNVAKTVSAAGSNTSQVCVFCHHPHRGSETFGAGSVLLWNINDASLDYPTYSSPTTNSVGMGGNVDKTSDSAKYTLLCMGCHDGGGTSNSFIRATVDGTLGAFPTLGTIAANLGTTLSDDHPVDFTYPLAVGTGDDIRVATVAGSDSYVVGASTNYPLYSGTMQCATCHDVHNGGSSGVQFMRGNNIIANSQICIDCHTKK